MGQQVRGSGGTGHAKANACRPVRKQERELFSKDLNAIFMPTQSKARALSSLGSNNGVGLFPSAVQIIDKDLDSLLTFFQFDPTYWTVLRTKNPIERLNKEFNLEVTEVKSQPIAVWPM